MMKFCYVHFLLFNTFIDSVIGTEELSLCANGSSAYNYPVATFCKDSQISDVQVVMDGYYAYLHPDMNCSCVVRVAKSAEFNFNVLNNFNGTVTLNSSCGSRIDIGTGALQLACSVFGQSLHLAANQNFDVVLEKTDPYADTRYCIVMRTAAKDANISITCDASLITKPTTETLKSTKPEISFPKVSPSKPVEVTNDFKSTSFNSLTNVTTNSTTAFSPMVVTTYLTTDVVTSNDHDEDENNVLYGAVAGGCVTAVILGIIILIFCLHRRKKTSKGNKPHSETSKHIKDYNDEYEDGEDGDGLKDNVLYVSAESATTNIHIRHSSKLLFDGHNDTIDLTGLDVSVQDKTNGNRICDKPMIAPKPKKSSSTRSSNGFETRSVPEHVLAPGDTGCEYAVVNKERPETIGGSDKYDTSLKPIIDHTYAVVDKTHIKC